jgi:hypothetical protein
MSEKILFNGQEYASEDEMPVEVRYAYQEVLDVLVDKNQNGVPDIIEQEAQIGKPRVVVNTRVRVNGQEYKNANEIPAEVRQSLGQLHKGQFEDYMPVGPNAPAEMRPQPATPIIPAVQQQSSIKTRDSRFYTALGVIVVLVMIILLQLGIIAAAYIR